MKTPTFLRSGLLLLAGLAAIPAFAADEFSHVFITHVLTATDGGGRRLFADGDSAMTVITKLDQPHYVLSPSVWLYREFSPQNNPDAAKHFCDNLVVSLTSGKTLGERKVATIVLANDSGVKKIEKELKRNPRYLEDLLTGY